MRFVFFFFARHRGTALRSTSADHRCRPRCLITDSSYNLLLLDWFSALETCLFLKWLSLSAAKKKINKEKKKIP